MFGIELLVMGLMIAANSVFAAYEIALASVTLARLHLLSGEGRQGAKAAAYMKENMEGSLAGVQLGITLVGAIAAATGGAGAEEQLAPTLQNLLGVTSGIAEVLAIIAVVLPLTVVTIIFGELIPKVFALRNKELVCLKLSPLMKFFVTAVWPVVWCLETAVTRLMAWGERRLQGRLGRQEKVRGGGTARTAGNCGHRQDFSINWRTGRNDHSRCRRAPYPPSGRNHAAGRSNQYARCKRVSDRCADCSPP